MTGLVSICKTIAVLAAICARFHVYGEKTSSAAFSKSGSFGARMAPQTSVCANPSLQVRA